MAASYIATTDVDAMIGTVRRQALFAPQGGSYDSDEYDRVVELASAAVKTAAQVAGYALGDTSTNDTVKLATLGQFLLLAYGRKELEVPAQFATAINLTEAIRTGAVSLPGLAPSTRDGVGGAKFSESSTSIDDASIQIFNRKEQNVY